MLGKGKSDWDLLLLFFSYSFDERSNIAKKLLASFKLPAHVGLVELHEFDVVAFLPVPKQTVVQIAMFSSKSVGLDDMLIKSGAHAAVLPESTPIFQEQSAHRVKNSIISAVDCKRKRLRGKVSARGFQAFYGFVPPIANRLCPGVFFQSETPSSSMIL